ncbi:MAG: hypothetical protein HQL01_11930 [Nitrospirae bacterium]|nr:hypothetical protein [Nitrospirota bacterium]
MNSMRYFNSVPLTIKLLIVTLIVGASIGGVSDYFMSDSIRHIVNKHLDETLAHQAKEDYIAFERYMSAYSQLAKLFVGSGSFGRYLKTLEGEKGFSPDVIKFYEDPPEWFLDNSLLRMFSYVQYALVFDSGYGVKEVYHASGGPPLSNCLSRSR